MTYRAFIIARPSGPHFANMEFGHVGWGLQLDATHYLVGAVENPSGKPYTPPGKTGLWSEVTTTPFERFALGPLGPESAYDTYKEILIEQPAVEAAKMKVQALANQPYAVFGSNCMDAAHEVLTAYGLTMLPLPSDKENYLPNDWFRHISCPAQPLAAPRSELDIILYEHPEYQGARKAFCTHEPELRVPNLRAGKWAAQASSLVARAGVVTLYTEENYTGHRLVMRSGSTYPFLGGWARLARSLTISAEPCAIKTRRTLSLPPSLAIEPPPKSPTLHGSART